jgi:hypothetical protein
VIFSIKNWICLSLALLRVRVVLIQFGADQIVKSICKAASVVRTVLQVSEFGRLLTIRDQYCWSSIFDSDAARRSRQVDTKAN